MTARKRNWIAAISLVAALAVAGLFLAASVISSRIEPYARQRAVSYLSERFDSKVELQHLHLSLPNISPIQLLLTLGRGGTARVEGEGLKLTLNSAPPNALPLFAIQKFSCRVSVESLAHPPVIVSEVLVDGMEVRIPPRGERAGAAASGAAPRHPHREARTGWEW